MNQYTNAVESQLANENKPLQEIKIGKVVEVRNGFAVVQFAGESTASNKAYPYIDGYMPVVNEYVALIPQGNTYLIMGCVKNGTPAPRYMSIADKTRLENGDFVVARANADENGRNIKDTYSEKGAEYLVRNSTGYIALVDLNLVPDITRRRGIGTNDRKFSTSYIENMYGTVAGTSDARKKNSIVNLSSRFKTFFNKLRPVQFKFNDGTSDRFHTGFIAQEVQKALYESGLSSQEFAGLVIDGDDYYLRYEEFIAVQTAVIQDLIKRVEELERREEK